MGWDLNYCVLIGRLTRDPELRYTPNGDAVCNFSIANNKGNKDEDVSFFNLVAWNKVADVVSKYLKKGRKVCVEGNLRQRRWEDANGQKRSIVEVYVNQLHFVDSNPNVDNADVDKGNDNAYQKPGVTNKGGNENFSMPSDNNEDDIIPY